MGLEREYEAYKRELPRLLEQGENGRFALIRGDAVISVWDTYRDAIQTGYDHFGLQPFMVKRVELVETPVVITRLLVPYAPRDAAAVEQRTIDRSPARCEPRPEAATSSRGSDCTSVPDSPRVD